MSDYHKDKIKEQGKQIAMLESEVSFLQASLAETIDAVKAISRGDDLDWHHEALEKAAKIIRSEGKG